MTLNEILSIMQNRIIALNEARRSAANSGDLDGVVKIDSELVTTHSSIEKIKLLLQLQDQQ